MQSNIEIATYLDMVVCNKRLASLFFFVVVVDFFLFPTHDVEFNITET